MHGKLHRLITQAVANRLKLPEPIVPFLCEGSEAPDRFADYETKMYVTRSGRVRTRKVRVKHHGTPFRVIKRTALKARHLLLKAEDAPARSEANWFNKMLKHTREDLQERGSYLAGRVLHYLQDNVIIGPSVDKLAHDKLERECANIDPASCIEKTKLKRLVCKKEVYKEIESVKTHNDPLEVMKRAIEHSYSVGSSIFSPSEAPPDLNKLGNEVYRNLKDKGKLILFYSAILLLVPIILLITTSSVILSFLTLLPSTILAAHGFVVARSRNINTVLRATQRMPRWIIYVCVGSFLTDIFLGGVGASICILLVILFYFLFLRSPAWKRIKDEIDWFKWVLQPTRDSI